MSVLILIEIIIIIIVIVIITPTLLHKNLTLCHKTFAHIHSLLRNYLFSLKVFCKDLREKEKRGTFFPVYHTAAASFLSTSNFTFFLHHIFA